MSSFASACKTLQLSPSSREHTCDPVGVILSQGGCFTHDHGQMMGPEFGLMEMSDVEYTHLQHLIQAHMEAHIAPPDLPNAKSHPASLMVKDAAGSTLISPFTTTQAIDLSTSTDEPSLVMPGEKTPVSYGEVPGFVLARIRGENSPTEPYDNSSTSSQNRSRSAARVCLEKRFNTMSADAPRQQDIQSAVLSNFLTILQQSAEAQEVIGLNPHMVEPNKHQGLIIPKGFSFNFRPERDVTKAHYSSGGNSTEEQQLVNIENAAGTPAAFRKHASTHSSQPIKAASAAPDSAKESRSTTRKRAQSQMSLVQRRERHNSKERERRKRIRLYCDELNTLVPFCELDTDKVTTLQWTTAFLRYINQMYGDTFKDEFQKAFTDGKGYFLKSSPSTGQDPLHREMDETLSIPLAVEQ